MNAQATAAGDLSRKESLWLGCRTKTCCSYYVVYPTGLDVWRIARQLQVAPWSFTKPVLAASPAPDTFALDDSGHRFRLVLQKRQRRGRTLQPCVFLLQLNDGTARCSLGDLRPAACHTFPALMLDDEVQVRNDGGCTCREWSIADIDDDRERRLLVNEQDERDTYCRVIANWNAFAVGHSADSPLDYRDFCRFLLDIYTELSSSPQPAEG